MEGEWNVNVEMAYAAVSGVMTTFCQSIPFASVWSRTWRGGKVRQPVHERGGRLALARFFAFLPVDAREALRHAERDPVRGLVARPGRMADVAERLGEQGTVVEFPEPQAISASHFPFPSSKTMRMVSPPEWVLPMWWYLPSSLWNRLSSVAL